MLAETVDYLIDAAREAPARASAWRPRFGTGGQSARRPRAANRMPTPATPPNGLTLARGLVFGLWFGSVAACVGQVVINEVHYHPSGNRPL